MRTIASTTTIEELTKKEFDDIRKSHPPSRHYGDRLLRYPTATTYNNYAKNRYADVLANENSRVILPAGKYINANYIDGFYPKQFIAAQAPLPSTFEDFWSMVWQSKVNIIVMLTQLIEKRRKKADLYFPTKEGEISLYGGLSVKLTRIVEYNAEILIRVFEMTQGEESRNLFHVQSVSWADCGVVCTSHLRLLIGLTEALQKCPHVASVRRETSTFCAPLLVHCSAGIGRTGTFIASYLALSFLLGHKEPNVKQIVTHLRKYRDNCVQTKEQYLLIHKIILGTKKDNVFPSQLIDASRLFKLHPSLLARATADDCGVEKARHFSSTRVHVPAF